MEAKTDHAAPPQPLPCSAHALCVLRRPALDPSLPPRASADSDLDDLDDEDDSDGEDLDDPPSLEGLGVLQPPTDPAPSPAQATSAPRKRKATPPPDGVGAEAATAARRSASPGPGTVGRESGLATRPPAVGPTAAAAAAKRPRVDEVAAAVPVTEEEVRTLLQARGRMPLKEIVAHFRARATGDNAKAFTALMRRVRQSTVVGCWEWLLWARERREPPSQ